MKPTPKGLNKFYGWADKAMQKAFKPLQRDLVKFAEQTLLEMRLNVRRRRLKRQKPK